MSGFDSRNGWRQRSRAPGTKGRNNAVPTDHLGGRRLSGIEGDIGVYRALRMSGEGDFKCF
jgi:hypothetical protein